LGQVLTFCVAFGEFLWVLGSLVLTEGALEFENSKQVLQGTMSIKHYFAQELKCFQCVFECRVQQFYERLCMLL